MTDRTGKRYENLAQVVFQLIVNQNDHVRNIDVKHDVVLKGKSTSHQIDVYWKFAVGTAEYQTIVQCKDHKNAVDQGELLKFKSVLDELPGQPKGIVVSRAGFQSGAIAYAKANGILLHELCEADYPPNLGVTAGGWATFRIIQMPLSGVIKDSDEDLEASRFYAMGFDYTVFTPTYSDIRFDASAGWLKEQYPGKDAVDITKKFAGINTPLHKNQLIDEFGESVGNIGKLFQELAQHVSAEGLTDKQVTHRFEKATFLCLPSPLLPTVKINSVSVHIRIDQRREVRRARMSNFTEWVLRDLFTKDTHWFAVTSTVSVLLPNKN
jgi:Restriction endonuclease